MSEQKTFNTKMIKEIVLRVLKASIKAALVIVIYIFVTPLLAPVSELVPDLMISIESFVIVFVVLMVLSDLTQNTIFQHFFNTARELYVIGYLLLSMGDGLMSLSYESISLTVNLTIFYSIAVLLSLLGLARSVLRAVDYMGKKAEREASLQAVLKP